MSDRDVSDCADAVEGLDDIGFEEGCEEILTDVIYELANPELTRPPSSETADEWIFHLKSHAAGSDENACQEQMPEHSDTESGRKKRLIPIDEELFGRLAKISESEHIPPEALIDLWLK